jgi:hypothetical protein
MNLSGDPYLVMINDAHAVSEVLNLKSASLATRCLGYAFLEGNGKLEFELKLAYEVFLIIDTHLR